MSFIAVAASQQPPVSVRALVSRRGGICVVQAVLLTAMLLLLEGCASVPPSRDILARMSVHGQAKLLEQLSLQNADFLPSGQQGIDAKLDASSDVLHLKEYNSYYHIYKIAPAQGKLKFIVRAYCSCLGFDKRMMVPVMQFLTDRGDVIDAPDIRYSLLQGEGFATPMSLKLRAFVPADRVRYVVVAADNSQPDSVVQGINSGLGGQIDIRSYPVGKFNLTYESL